jgi:lysozyme
MNLSNAGLELLKRSEGLRLRVYRDVAGFQTIGYGHRILCAEHYLAGITEAQAAALLAQDVEGAEDCVRHLVRVPLTQGQFDALVDFIYNLGVARLANSTLLRELNAGRYDDAAQQLLLWDHAGEKEIAGLKARREAEYTLWKGAHEQPAG